VENQASGCRCAAGYETVIHDSHISLRKLDSMEYRQLKMRFEDDILIT
jgi:hypothetical protein